MVGTAAEFYDGIGQHERVHNLIKWDQDRCRQTVEYLENDSLRDCIKEIIS